MNGNWDVLRITLAVFIPPILLAVIATVFRLVSDETSMGAFLILAFISAFIGGMVMLAHILDADGWRW